MPKLDDVEVTIGAELPDITFLWNDDDGDPINWVTDAHSFVVRVAERGDTTDLGLSITAAGAADSTVTLTLAEGAIDGLTAGRTYDVQVWASRSSDGKEREPAKFRMHVKAAIA